MAKTRAQESSGLAFAFLSAASAGSAAVVGKMILADLSAQALACFWYLVSVVFTGAWLRWRGGSFVLPLAGRARRVFVLHVIFSSVGIWAFWEGLHGLEVGVASFVERAETLFVLLFAVWFLRERFVAAEMPGVLLSLAGVVVMKLPALRQWGDPELNAEWFAFGLILLSAVSIALGELFSKLAARNVPATTFTFHRSVWMTLWFAVLVLFDRPALSDFSGTVVGLLLLGGLLGPVFGRVLIMLAYERISLMRATMIGQLEPVFAAVVAFAVLAERMVLDEWVGGLMIVAGSVVLVRARHASGPAS